MDLSLPDISAVDKIITCTVEGILEPGDLRALMVERGEIVGQSVEGAGPSTLPEVEDPTNLKRIRERHHSVARQIAAGTPPTPRCRHLRLHGELSQHPSQQPCHAGTC